jgi:hypothetical protein
MVLREPENHSGSLYHCYGVGESGFNKTEPPVVIATSTNNQAVTNIIEAFGKDFLPAGPMAGRWLPDVKALALTSLLQAEKPRQQKIPDGRLFNRVESLEYVEDARFFFLEKARAAFRLWNAIHLNRLWISHQFG